MITRSVVKYIQSLGDKKAREQEGRVVVEGPKIIAELLKEQPEAVKHVYATKKWLSQFEHTLPASADAEEVSEQELSRISFLSSPSDILSLVELPHPEPFKPSPHGFTLLLDQIQDPGNLGTIIRTGDWFGIGHIMCSPDTADAFSPKVVQASMGSVFRIQVHYADLSQIIQAHDRILVFAAVLDGRSIDEVKPVTPGFLIIGNESKGVSAELRKDAVQGITIPRLGGAESLNAAVATGVLLSWLTRPVT
ncbi:MAG: TrmH family RNA methyltransferase [Bacteroidota bacterium]